MGRFFGTTWAGSEWLHKHVPATGILELQHREFWGARFGKSLAPALDAWEQQRTDWVGTSTVQQAEHQGSPQLPADLSKSFYSFSDDWMQDIFMPARDATEGLRWWRTTKRDCKPL